MKMFYKIDSLCESYTERTCCYNVIVYVWDARARSGSPAPHVTQRGHCLLLTWDAESPAGERMTEWPGRAMDLKGQCAQGNVCLSAVEV
jgi:hypothetical protein